MIRCNDRHMPMIVGQQNAMPHVDGLRPYSGRPVIAPPIPAYSSGMVIEQVGLPVYIAKIAQAVIRSVVVNVVNVVRLFAMRQKPSKAVSKQAAPFVVNPYITVAVEGAGWSSFPAANRLDAANDSSFGVVAKAFANRIRDNFRSHVVPPYDVVRGLVVGATSTPIIPMVSNIGNTEFAVSGGRSGDNLFGPLFINPITLQGPEFM